MKDEDVELLLTGQQWYERFVAYAKAHSLETFENIPTTDYERGVEVTKLFLKWARESSGAHDD